VAELMQTFERAPWLSKKWTAFALACLTLIACILLGADSSVTGNLSNAIMLGLPVLLGGQSLIDARVRGQAVQQ
jgi:hypothetical protein